jgi:DNA methyltransferase 1-associated protein 1
MEVVDSNVYAFAKYNIKPRLPKKYTDEQYDRYLISEDWTREETDYLLDLVEEYDLRWILIADRYDFQQQREEEANEADSAALVPANRYRTMEQMKARYYTIAANILALEHPPSEMSEAEFELHEKMMKFDPERESGRKELAALQLNRTADEVREEGVLLEELKRIVANEQNFISERKELYSRLEVPISVGNTTMYQSSQGLAQLLQSLLQADKTKKRRSLIGPEGTSASPISQTPTQNVPLSARDSRADTPTGLVATSSTKKSAAAGVATTGAAITGTHTQPTVKTLTPAEETKYGVQHHDRLAAGVQFRNEKAIKLTQAKSNIQTQKLAAALAELEVPLRLVMPTERVCKEFEKLVHSVNLFLDARKVSEKVESEIRVLEAMKEERQRKEREAQGNARLETEVKSEEDPQTPGVDSNLNDSNALTEGGGDEVADEAEDSDDAPGEADSGEPGDVDSSGSVKATPVKDREAVLSNHKRSASVLSSVSDKSTKRQKR